MVNDQWIKIEIKEFVAVAVICSKRQPPRSLARIGLCLSTFHIWISLGELIINYFIENQMKCITNEVLKYMCTSTGVLIQLP